MNEPIKIVHDKKTILEGRDPWDIKLGFYMDIRHRDKDGNLLYEELGSHNMIVNEGLESIWDGYFRGATAPTQFKMDLYTNTSGLDKDSTLSTFTEPTETGYAAVTVEKSAVGWPTLTATGGQMRITSKECTFTAQATWTTVYGAYIWADYAGTDKAICWDGFSSTRTLQSGDSLDVTLYIERENPTAE